MTPENWFHQRATFYVEAQILFHLNQVGVFQHLLSDGSCTSSKLANDLDLNPSAIEALLDYVVGVDDILDKNNDNEYEITPFGERVLARFSNSDTTDNNRINMFDVRVGAYGPVWENLTFMLKKEKKYGQDFIRNGKYAENGVSKIAKNFAPILNKTIEKYNIKTVVEIGSATGLLKFIHNENPEICLNGIDKSPTSIEETKNILRDIDGRINLVCEDFFDTGSWLKTIEKSDVSKSGMIYSIHFHELLAKGYDKLVDTISKIKQKLPGWIIIALEQPRLEKSERDSSKETLWLYGQSNILIHHLIGNGRILSEHEWLQLGKDSGCIEVTSLSCEYLGYKSYCFQL